MTRPRATQLRLPLLDPAPAPGKPGGSVLDERNATEYVEMTCRSILSFARGSRLSDCYTVNPYRGCEFGCAYCYARYTHAFLGFDDPSLFQRRIFVKANAPDALRRDLARRRDVTTHGIAIGTATDPYQPAERRFRVTRGILEGLLPYAGLDVSLVTKSGLVARDAALLGELSRRHDVTVLISCITLDPALQRSLEPRAHTPTRRFAAMRALASAGVRVGLIVAPVLPGITDDAEGLEALVARAAEAGASFVLHDVLYLTDCSRPVFLPWIERHRPELRERYERAYGRAMCERPEYYAEVARAVDAAMRKAGFARAANDDGDAGPARAMPGRT